MRPLLLAALLFATPAHAQSLGETTGVNKLVDRAPSGSDVLLGMHQFDLFQQSVADSADKRGDASLKKVAKTLEDAANARDDAIATLSKNAKLKLEFPDDPSAMRTNRLGGLEGSVGQVYLQSFYKAEITEHENGISLLKRYLARPDNDSIKAFASKQLPALEKSLAQSRAALEK